jgi:hypothetical protein
MKYYLVMIVTVVFVATACQAITIFQPWDVNDWTKVTQAGTGNSINVQPDGAAYVSVTPIGRNNFAGFTGLYKSIGTTIIPAGTAGGDVPDCWMQYDCRYDGEGTNYNISFGLYNSNGSNNGSPAVWERIGIQTSGQDVQALGKNSAADVADLPNTDLNLIERVKMHIYTYDSNTVMDVEVYIYDPNTDTATLAYSLEKYVVLKSSQSFTNSIDVIGIRNTNASGSPSRISNYSLDNMYFSTDGPKTDAVPAPTFASICISTADNDFTGDCNVNFADLAVMSEEWLQVGMVPARVFQW